MSKKSERYWIHSDPDAPSASLESDPVAVAVDELVGNARSLLPQVARLIAEQGDPGPREIQFGHFKVSASPAPWNDEAAALFFEIHAGARDIERGLRALLSYAPLRRGGGDVDTVAALAALPALLAVALDRYPHHEPVIVRGRFRTVNPRRAARDVESWPRKCRALLDAVRKDEEQWTQAPGNLLCPYCDRPLRLAPDWEYRDPDAEPIWCRNCPKHPTPDGDSPHVQFEAGVWLGVLEQQAKDQAAAKAKAWANARTEIEGPK